MRHKRQRHTLKRRHPSITLRPGSFYYGSAMVWEVDNQGVKHARPNLGPNSGKFKHKYYKKGKAA